MADERKNVLIENMSVIATPDGFQKYILGTKKNGDPRAVYDVIKDIRKKDKKKKKGKKHKKHGKNGKPTQYSVYLSTKKKKKHKKGKHWHI